MEVGGFFLALGRLSQPPEMAAGGCLSCPGIGGVGCVFFSLGQGEKTNIANLFSLRKQHICDPGQCLKLTMRINFEHGPILLPSKPRQELRQDMPGPPAQKAGKVRIALNSYGCRLVDGKVGPYGKSPCRNPNLRGTGPVRGLPACPDTFLPAKSHFQEVYTWTSG